MSLANKPLVSCNKSSSPLSGPEIKQLIHEIDNWCLVPENGIDKISRRFKFKDYLSAQEFASKVADLAEAENHHPRVCIEWGMATVSWWTHCINGLFINDFIMAARCDHLCSTLK